MKTRIPHRLGTTAELPGQIDQEGIGIYLLTSSEECEKRNGGRYLRLSLEDATGKVAGIAWTESLPCLDRPPTPAPVRVKGAVESFNGQPQIHVESLVALGTHEVPSASALLPLNWCPARARHALPLLAAMETALTDPLDGFLRQVLLDPLILRGFLTCRGSGRRNHRRDARSAERGVARSTELRALPPRSHTRIGACTAPDSLPFRLDSGPRQARQPGT